MTHFIITILTPPGANLSMVLAYLQKVGTIELQGTTTVVIDAGKQGNQRRLLKRLLLLRATVQALLGVRVRVGAAVQKSVSLVAARRSHPGGITIVPQGNEHAFLDRIEIDLLPGIGRRTASYLRNRGITTIGKFSRMPQAQAVELFGKSGIILREYSRGSDPREVLPFTRARQLPFPSHQGRPSVSFANTYLATGGTAGASVP